MKLSRFESIGLYLPEKILSTDEIVKQLKDESWFELLALTGIKNRRYRAENESTYSFALNAMRDCLKNSKYEAKDLDIIISCSISRFDTNGNLIYEPSIALTLKESIGATSAKFFNIGNACAGMGTGVHILNNMIKAGTVKTGMVVSGELITPILDTAILEIKNTSDHQFSSLTVGDAGVAIIMDNTSNEKEAIDYTHFTTLPELCELCLGIPSHESGKPAMYADSLSIHREVIGKLGRFMQHVFEEKTGSPVWDQNYRWYIPHQAGLSAIAKALIALRRHFKLNKEYCNRILISKYVKEFGNTASTSNFLVLYNALKDGIIKKGDKVILHMAASGVVLGVISFTVGDLEKNGTKVTH